jgi:heterodisulfide reductase subunit D
MGLYQIPRDVINHIPDIHLVEMQRNRNHAWCCGAGGGVKIGYPEWAVDVSNVRLNEAKDTKAKIIASTCPFCKTNLTDANEKFNMGFEVLDLIEILDQMIIEVK